jgi:hypothetical protein
MKTTNMILIIVVSLVLCGTSFAASKSDRFYVPQPDQAFEGKVKTRMETYDQETLETSMKFIDKAGKPIGIYQHIGRRPILAFGNSDSDMQMIEYTMAG